jgi:hypothetical protein
VVGVPAKQALFFKVAKELRERVDVHEDPEAGRSAAKPLTEKIVDQEG